MELSEMTATLDHEDSEETELKKELIDENSKLETHEASVKENASKVKHWMKEVCFCHGAVKLVFLCYALGPYCKALSFLLPLRQSDQTMSSGYRGNLVSVLHEYDICFLQNLINMTQ